jgi:GNAT superfamily N-acetyltransferase
VRRLITRVADSIDTLNWIHRNTFPSDVIPEWARGSWWVTRDADTKRAVAFVGVEPVESWPMAMYLSRVGVVEDYRGKGIQRFLMKKVEQAARSAGFTHIISSTLENPPSANNFIKCGYKTYLPESPWGYAGTIYWTKEL